MLTLNQPSSQHSFHTWEATDKDSWYHTYHLTPCQNTGVTQARGAGEGPELIKECRSWEQHPACNWGPSLRAYSRYCTGGSWKSAKPSRRHTFTSGNHSTRQIHDSAIMKRRLKPRFKAGKQRVLLPWRSVYLESLYGDVWVLQVHAVCEEWLDVVKILRFEFGDRRESVVILLDQLRHKVLIKGQLVVSSDHHLELVRQTTCKRREQPAGLDLI